MLKNGKKWDIMITNWCYYSGGNMMSRENGMSHSNKYDTLELLNRVNSVRAFALSLILATVVPLFIVYVNVSQRYVSNIVLINVLLGFFNVIFLGLGIWGFFLLKDNETDKLKIYYRGIYIFTGLASMIIAGFDMAVSHSVFIPVAAIVCIALVPILQKKERCVYLITMLVGMLITALIAKNEFRTVVEIAAAGLVGCWLGNTFQYRFIDHERTIQKLKAKTISSESDPLTGLANRRGLNHKVSVLWPYCARNKETVGVIEIDVDFFKKYNDRFGHPAGDKCLKHIANTIRNTVAGITDIVARTGGEEFIVFVHEKTEEEVIELALKIREAIDKEQIPHAYVGIANHVTVSMGVSVVIPNAGNSFDQLYEDADNALYVAKSSGRHCVVCGNRIYGRMRNGLGAVINS